MDYGYGIGYLLGGLVAGVGVLIGLLQLVCKRYRLIIRLAGAIAFLVGAMALTTHYEQLTISRFEVGALGSLMFVMQLFTASHGRKIRILCAGISAGGGLLVAFEPHEYGDLGVGIAISGVLLWAISFVDTRHGNKIRIAAFSLVLFGLLQQPSLHGFSPESGFLMAFLGTLFLVVSLVGARYTRGLRIISVSIIVIALIILFITYLDCKAHDDYIMNRGDF